MNGVMLKNEYTLDDDSGGLKPSYFYCYSNP
jgi:hypothetical protein